MDIHEIRKLDRSSLDLEVIRLKKELLDMRLKLMSGQVKDTSMFKKKRIAVARALTVIQEK